MNKIDTGFNCDGYIESLIGGRSENQDAAGWTEGPLGLLVVVCDGMGGLKGGKVASQTAVDVLISEFKNCPSGRSVGEFLTSSISKANSAVLDAGRELSASGIGTTVTALILNEKCATIAHIGDSRVYQLRKKRKVFRTFDHSMVFDFVKAGIITEEQARLSANSNVITRALGISEDIAVDIEEVSYNSGDRFILCTDGFWAATDEATFIQRLSCKKEVKSLLSFTTGQIDEEGNASGGGHDNLTAAIIDVFINSKKKPKMRTELKITGGCLVLLLIVSIWFNIRSIKVYSALKELTTIHQELIESEESFTADKIEKVINMSGIHVKDTTDIDLPEVENVN